MRTFHSRGSCSRWPPPTRRPRGPARECDQERADGAPCTAPAPSRQSPPPPRRALSGTTNILFIVGGAFDGIQNIVKNRLGKKTIGFGAENELNQVNSDEWQKYLTTGDLVKFGLIPEFIGRIPIITTLDKLSAQDLIRILTEPKNALTKQYKKLLSLDNVDLTFTDGALKAIADLAISRHMGARGLRSIIENSLMDIMYRTPSEDDIEGVQITKDVITKHAQPKVTYKSDDKKEDKEVRAAK